VDRDLEQAKQLLKERSLAFAVVKEGEVIGTSVGKGVVDLLALVDSRGAALAGASLADKLVGKAVAAMVCGVPLEYDELVSMVLSRDRKTRGPLEQLLVGIQDPDAAVDALRDFISRQTMDHRYS